MEEFCFPVHHTPGLFEIVLNTLKMFDISFSKLPSRHFMASHLVYFIPTLIAKLEEVNRTTLQRGRGWTMVLPAFFISAYLQPKYQYIQEIW